MWRTWRRWMDDLAKVLFKVSNQKSNMKTSWVINRIKTCIVKRDWRLLTSFSMWQNSLINRASPWELAKQLENNDARKISSIKIWNLVSQRMFQPFPHSLDRHYHWRSPNNSIKAGWGLKLSWRELPHAHRQYGMYDGICLIMSSSMRTCAENFGKLGPELKVQNYHYWSSSSSSSPALVLVSLQACSIVRPGSRHRSARSSPWGLRAWCPCCLTITSLRSRCLLITSFCSSEKARSLRNLYPTTCRATFNLESVHQRSTGNHLDHLDQPNSTGNHLDWLEIVVGEVSSSRQGASGVVFWVHWLFHLEQALTRLEVRENTTKLATNWSWKEQ